MSDQTTPRDDAPTLLDPDSLREREDVEFLEETAVHDDRDHCAVGIEGRAVVGVTDADGNVLVLVDDERDFAMLPNGAVESGDDWADVGRKRVEHLMDLPVEIDGVERVRTVEHVLKGSGAHRDSDDASGRSPRADDESHTTSQQVVFSASPTADTDRVTDGCDWRAEWTDDVPEHVADDEGPAADDVRLFVD